MPPRLSILICSLYSRLEKRRELLKLLCNCIGNHRHSQITPNEYSLDRYAGKEAEVVILTDDKQLTVGDKRNLLVEAAHGDYISFIDDDDMVTFDYVEELLKATCENKDVIVFDAYRYENGQPDRRVSYDKSYGRDYNRSQLYCRLPNHLMCFKKELAASVTFPEISFGEDAEWARRILPKIQTQHRIYKVLYEYWFDRETTETQNPSLP